MIKQFTFNHFETNCYIVIDEASKECLIVDPCMEATYEDCQIKQYISDNQLKVVDIALTHAHVDHIAGVQHAVNIYNIPLSLHPSGKKLLSQAPSYGMMMGFKVEALDTIPIIELHHKDTIKVGSLTIECRDVSGHCLGSMAYVIPKERKVITGDALFRGSIGRTDLPGGDLELLLHNIREQLLVLDDDYSVLPGHGDCSTIGDERNNPFLFLE